MNGSRIPPVGPDAPRMLRPSQLRVAVVVPLLLALLVPAVDHPLARAVAAAAGLLVVVVAPGVLGTLVARRWRPRPEDRLVVVLVSTLVCPILGAFVLHALSVPIGRDGMIGWYALLSVGVLAWSARAGGPGLSLPRFSAHGFRLAVVALGVVAAAAVVSIHSDRQLEQPFTELAFGLDGPGDPPTSLLLINGERRAVTYDLEVTGAEVRDRRVTVPAGASATVPLEDVDDTGVEVRLQWASGVRTLHWGGRSDNAVDLSPDDPAPVGGS